MVTCHAEGHCVDVSQRWETCTTWLRKRRAVLGVQVGFGIHSAVVLHAQTSDLLAGLRLATDAPPAAVGAHEEAGGSAGAGASQVRAAPSQQGSQPQCP
jgi:hypothetical protein